MTLVQTLLTTQIIVDSLEAFPVGNWGCYQESISPIEFVDGYFTGNYENWGGTIRNDALNSFTGPAYAGYTTNWGGTPEVGALDSFINAAYAGYTTNFGGNTINPIPDMAVVDVDSVINNPKDQFIYYKLKGYNPNTLSYETWIEKENITARPELFDPGNNPPTYERNVNLISPSGAALVNITIVARWIQ
jgi:hypothetical protein